jgi:two-component system, NtrC family, response regulator AtoC
MAAPTVNDPRSHHAAEPGATRYHLVVLGPEGAMPLALPQRGEILVGRDERADVRIVDPLVSRQHARLYIGEDLLEIEDLGSANGTRVRDRTLPARERTAISPGDAIHIGDNVLLIQRREPGFEARRAWAHGHLEIRLIEECARAQSRRSHFALARVRVDGQEPAIRTEKVIAAALRAGDVLAAYGPNEYEALLVDSEEGQSKRVGEEILEALAEAGMKGQVGLAFFPTDSTSPQGLVSRACERLRGDPPAGAVATAGADVVVESQAMRALHGITRRAAIANINILIIGETGVGKEILAETVHRLSARRDRPFLPLNCAALTESLIESELFGYERGAFTGAFAAKAGLLESAEGGTVFLDEIGEMPMSVQAKLLRVIESRQVYRIGGRKPTGIDVRFVSATNRDLEEEVAEKRFRQDLFFRLNGITLEIPPLRERPEEIDALALHFLRKFAAQSTRPMPVMSPEGWELLRSYSWPGNIRELRNVIERACLLCAGSTITPEHLPAGKMLKSAPAAPAPAVSRSSPANPAPAIAAAAPVVADPATPELKKIERDAILDALERCVWNQTRAAELLSMSRRTFCKKLKDHNIPRPRSA